jgi:hypothetical protein
VVPSAGVAATPAAAADSAVAATLEGSAAAAAAYGTGAGVVVAVGNLPFSSTWRDIKDVFNQVAPVLRADITSRGCGTVSFSTMDEAIAAVRELQGSDLGGRPMSVRIARD